MVLQELTHRIVPGRILVPFYKKVYSFEELLDANVYKEKVNCLKNKNTLASDNTYFIIRRSYRNIGLATHLCVYIAFIAYAVNKGYIPIIDMKMYPNIYQEKDEEGKINSWEKYFLQPMGIGIDDIPKGAKIRYSSPIFLPERTPFITSLKNKAEYALYRNIYKDFVHFNNVVQKYTDEELEMLSGKNVIGCLCRGTDYTAFKPKGHPVQPDFEMIVDKVEEFMEKHKCEYVYIATDEYKAEKIFREKWNNRVLINKRNYFDELGIDFKKTGISEVSFDRDNDAYLKGLEYLASINILAHCKYFIGGGCAGTYAAEFMTAEDFVEDYVFNLGFY